MIMSERLQKLQAEIERSCILKEPVKISDGKYVTNYIDLYRLTCQPSWLTLITSELRSRIFEMGWDYKYIAGKELHGALLASHMNCDTLILRKYTSLEVIEKQTYVGPNNIVTGTEVILVDDITSAGVTMENSIERLSREFDIIGAISVVCRGSGALEVSKKWDIPFEYLLYIPEENMYG